MPSRAIHRLTYGLIGFCFLFLYGTALSGCTTLSGLMGESATNTVRQASLAAMQTYHDAWQPLLNVYGNLPVCSATQKAPCQDAKLYRKLYDADGAIATCSVAATAALSATNPDMTQVSACLAQIGVQQASIAQVSK